MGSALSWITPAQHPHRLESGISDTIPQAGTRARRENQPICCADAASLSDIGVAQQSNTQFPNRNHGHFEI
jgi:hypothetical protein